MAAGDSAAPGSFEALTQLCQSYWFPLYAYVRRRGRSPEDAQDLTQAFFARFLEKEYFARADQSRGRFRTFLLASMKHDFDFIHNLLNLGIFDTMTRLSYRSIYVADNFFLFEHEQ